VSIDPAAADDAGLEDADELEEPAAEEAAAPAAGAEAAAASGKHASIVFSLEGKKASGVALAGSSIICKMFQKQLHLCWPALEPTNRQQHEQQYRSLAWSGSSSDHLHSSMPRMRYVWVSR
jgi:hypothetical protein